jgi:O-antigen ligase
LSDAGVFDGSYIYDEDFSSINTRLTLWQITIQIITDHYFSGVGNLVWNFMKYDYGSPFDVLLDPHSDYLNYLVSYGLLLGGGIIFYFFAKPLLISLTLRGEFRYRRTWLIDHYFVFFSFLLPVCISSFSNSNTMKHQLFFIFCFAALTCLQLSRSIVYDSSRQDL